MTRNNNADHDPADPHDEPLGNVTYADELPDITPADDVIHVNGETRVIHGPGHETRVRNDEEE